MEDREKGEGIGKGNRGKLRGRGIKGELRNHRWRPRDTDVGASLAKPANDARRETRRGKEEEIAERKRKSPSRKETETRRGEAARRRGGEEAKAKAGGMGRRWLKRGGEENFLWGKFWCSFATLLRWPCVDGRVAQGFFARCFARFGALGRSKSLPRDYLCEEEFPLRLPESICGSSSSFFSALKFPYSLFAQWWFGVPESDEDIALHLSPICLYSCGLVCIRGSASLSLPLPLNSPYFF